MELCLLFSDLFLQHPFLPQFLSPSQLNLLFLELLYFDLGLLDLGASLKLLLLGLLQLLLFSLEIFEYELLGGGPNGILTFQLLLKIFYLFLPALLLFNVFTFYKDEILKTSAS